MATQAPHDRRAARDRLWAYEQIRREKRQRKYAWNAQIWESRLADLSTCEDSSDQLLQQQIDALWAGSPDQITLEQWLEATIHGDIRWYEWFHRELHTLRVRWEERRLHRTPAFAELRQHERMVEDRLLRRKVRLQQSALECLERRRQHRGRLDPGEWRHRWAYLQAAFGDQDEFYRREYVDGTPAHICVARLEWLRRVRAIQRQTEEHWGRHKHFDDAGYRVDASTLDAAITRLLPAPPRRGGGSGAIVLAIVVVLALAVGLGMWIGVIPRPFSSGTQPTNPVTTPIAPGPTAQPMQPPATPTVSQEAQTHYQNGLDLLRRGQCEQAIAEFDGASLASPRWHLPHNDAAFCLYELGRTDAAITRWRKALDLYSDSPDANAGLGTALYASGQRKEGLDHYQRAIDFDRGYRDESWLRDVHSWGVRALTGSRALREELRR